MVRHSKKSSTEENEAILKNETKNLLNGRKNKFPLHSMWYEKSSNNDAYFLDKKLSSSNNKSKKKLLKSESIHSIFFSIYENNYTRLEQELLELHETNINSIYYAGQSPLHAACLSKRLKTLQILLKYGAKHNTVNSFGNTPLHVAVSENWIEGAEELMNNDASADTITENLLTVKEVIRQNPLHVAIKAGNVKMVDMILKYEPNLTLTDGNKNSVLHMAACSHSAILIKRLIALGDMESRNIDKNTPLHSLLKCDSQGINEESESKTFQCTYVFVEEGAEVNTMNVFGETPLYLACKNNLHQSVDHLIKAGADPTTLTKEGKSVIHASCMSECARSLCLVLKTQLVNHLIIAEDQEGETPFHKAVNSFSIDSCELLLKNGDRLGNKDNKGLTRCSLVLNQMPNAMELLTRVFDYHTKVSSKYIHSPSFKVIFGYCTLMMKPECTLQVSLISELTSERFKEILKHPLLESYLCLKWSKIKPLFYLSVFLYTLFLLTHTTFLVLTYGNSVIFPWDENQKLLTTFRILYTILFVLLLPPEGVALSVNFKKYLLQMESFLKLINYSTALFLIATADKNLDTLLQRDVACLSVLSGWILLMIAIGRFPTFGVYVLMFLKISKSIIKFLISFSFLIVGFACSFLILFHGVKTFKNLPLTLVKTLMMMIGEIEYTDIYEQGNLTSVYHEQADHRLVFVYANDTLKLLVLCSFLFLVPVLMANLLVGLAVNDIPDLQRQGKILRLLKQAVYIVGSEHVLVKLNNSHFFPKSLLKMLTEYFSICGEVSVHPNKTLKSSFHKLNIPAETLKEAIVIGAKIEEISAKESLCQSRMDMKDHFKQFYKQYTKDTKELHERISKTSNRQNSQGEATMEAIELLKREVQNQSRLISQLSQQLSCKTE